MKFFLKLVHDFKILIINYMILLFGYYLRFQIVFLNKIVNNYWLFFIYIILLIHAFFGCIGSEVCASANVMSWFLVTYLQVTSIEIFVLCKVSISRKWVIQVVGSDYFLANFPKKAELVLKYFLPLLFLLFLEMLTTILSGHLTSYLHRISTSKYRDIYGYDGVVWPDIIKEQYLAEQWEILSVPSHGIVCHIAHKINFFLNSMIEIIINFI